MYPYVHCSITYMVAKTWKQPMYPSMDGWIKKMWCVYNGVLFSHKKEWNPASYDIMDGSWLSGKAKSVRWKRTRRITWFHSHVGYKTESNKWTNKLLGTGYRRWLPEGGDWGEDEGAKGDQMHGDRERTDVGGEHTMQCNSDVSQNCTLGTYMLLTNVTPINLI